MFRWAHEARKRWRTLAEARAEMDALREENELLDQEVRKCQAEVQACMTLVRALRGVNADLDARLLQSRELTGIIKVFKEGRGWV